jgi:hypothetical protein
MAEESWNRGVDAEGERLCRVTSGGVEAVDQR